MELFFVVLVTVTFIALSFVVALAVGWVCRWIDGKLPHEW